MPTKQDHKKFLQLTLKQWFWLLFLLPTFGFVMVSLFILIYSTIPWPVGDLVKMGQINSQAEEVIVLVHGKGDRPSSWAEGFARELETSVLTAGQQVVTVDWSEYSSDLFRSTLNARRIGHSLGERLVRHNNVRRLHLIGHSAGSFVVYGICEAVKKSDRNLFVQTTYLDPVGIYGGVDWGYGPRNFGSCADLSDAYIDTEDGVPGSNAPLDHPHTFDVTALKKAAGYRGLPHLWPVEYYRQAVLAGTLPYWQPQPADLLSYPPRRNTVLR